MRAGWRAAHPEERLGQRHNNGHVRSAYGAYALHAPLGLTQRMPSPRAAGAKQPLHETQAARRRSPGAQRAGRPARDQRSRHGDVVGDARRRAAASIGLERGACRRPASGARPGPRPGWAAAWEENRPRLAVSMWRRAAPSFPEPTGAAGDLDAVDAALGEGGREVGGVALGGRPFEEVVGVELDHHRASRRPPRRARLPEPRGEARAVVETAAIVVGALIGATVTGTAPARIAGEPPWSLDPVASRVAEAAGRRPRSRPRAPRIRRGDSSRGSSG